MKKIIAVALMLPSIAPAAEVYMQFEAMHVKGSSNKRTGTYTNTLFTLNKCEGFHCYEGHNLLTAEIGVSHNKLDLFVRHVSSADANDEGINSIGVRKRFSYNFD
jgi:hypothetical protein